MTLARPSRLPRPSPATWALVGRCLCAATLASTLACRPSASGVPAPPATVTSSAGTSVVAQATARPATASNPKENISVSSRTYEKPPVSELKEKLTPIQFEVTQHEATEPPFHNDFWDNHAPGLYVDVATGEPLFSSTDKFESGTGWPSFVRPIEEGHVVEKSDRSLWMTRTEVRSRAGGSHLGHVFDDGPAPTGMRYCINSASLRFIPVDRLEAEGYGAYAARFKAGGGAASIAPATSNSCATPPEPGKHAGCETTLDMAFLSGTKGSAATLRAIPGVLEVEPGKTSGTAALRVVFDPKQVTLDVILTKWASAEAASAPSGLVVFSTSREQREAASSWTAGRRLARGAVAVKDADVASFTAD